MEPALMTEMFHFTTANFQSEVLDSPTPVLVDFTAEWCGPCHMLAPIVAKLNDEWNGAVKVGKLDIDQETEVAMQYGIMGVPTLLLFRGGQPVERLSGFMQRERILSKLQPHLS
jgi:thioredoxin 1